MMKLRDENGRFTTDELENLEVNNMLKSICGLQPTPEPEPTPTTHGTGQPVPLRLAPNIPVEDESEAMNHLLRQFCGIYNDSR